MFWERFNYLCANKGVSANAAAKDLSIASGTVSEWKKGRVPLNSTLKKIAEYFDVPVDYLLGQPSRHQKPVSGGVRIPVFGDVAAGIPILAIENYDSDDPDDWEEISQKMASGGDYFALRIHGDSMEPKISNGDIVIVRIQDTVENNEIAIVRVNGEEATCKRVQKTPEGLALLPTNPSYEPMFFTPKQVRELPVEIIGRVVEVRAKL